SGSLVVAAAGNNGSDVGFYPAAYEDVLSVGSVSRQFDDVISHFSNYGFHVDVFAMGEGLMSTFFEYFADTNTWVATYQRNTGTSMAAPVVSGLAALIKAGNPDWSPQRIASQIRTNARPIYDVNSSSIYENKLGRGLIDAHGALVNLKPGLTITDFSFKTHDGSKINTGEQGRLTLEGTNHGEPTGSSRLTLESGQAGIGIQPTSRTTGSIENGQDFSLIFEIDISRDYRLDEIPLFRLDFADQTLEYEDFYMIEYERLLFDIIDINTISASFSSDGTIGFMDALSAVGGIGFLPGDYKNVLFEGGLMIAAEADVDILLNPARVVVNQVRETDQTTRHFLPSENYRFRQQPEVSDLDGHAVFKSTEHPIARGLTVEMETFAFDEPLLDQTIMVVYEVINTSMDTYRDMYIGLFNDWDIRDSDNNLTGYVEDDSLIYAYAPGGGPYVTSAHLGSVASALAIDNASTLSLADAETREDSLRFGIFYRPDQANLDGFTNPEKRLSLTAGTERTTVENTDISLVTSSGPFTLHPYARIRTGFIYAWGENVEELRNQVAAARQLDFGISPPGEYLHVEEIADQATIYQNFPNPFNQNTIIEFHLGEPGPAELVIYDVLGRRVATIFDGVSDDRIQFVPFDASDLATGVYIAVLRAEGRTETMKMTLVR
ncbi:MAG: S8 family serine peptidase, partial [Bacteroidota bacterium]